MALDTTPLLEFKEDDGADDLETVTKALEDLQKTVNGRIDDLDVKGLTKRLDDLETKANRPGAKQGEDSDEVKAERKAFAAYLRLGQQTPEAETKALVSSSDPQGGYFAPAEMSSEFIRDLVETSPVRSVASVRTTSAASIKYPRRTGITNATWGGENVPTENSQPSFGQAEVAVHELKTHTDISNTLMADGGAAVEAEVRLALSEDFGQKEGVAFVNGTGAGQPEGILTNSDIATFANGSIVDVSADALIKMMYALPAMYRGRGTWAMNGTTLGVLRTLKDGDGRFLWQPSYQAGQPETILGRPVVELVDMPDVAEDATPIIYGDWSGYRIVDRVAMSILSNPYLLATEGMTRLHATRRTGGRVLEPAKFRKLIMEA